MAKIKIDNVLKIVDIHHSQLSPGLLQYLKQECEETYTDRVMNEHIWNISDIFDQYREDADYDPDILSEMETLMGLQNKKNAGYIRIIYS